VFIFLWKNSDLANKDRSANLVGLNEANKDVKDFLNVVFIDDLTVDIEVWCGWAFHLDKVR
jgi:hypothetical protein